LQAGLPLFQLPDGRFLEAVAKLMNIYESAPSAPLCKKPLRAGRNLFI
jgi:hypothetical protein